MIVLSPPGSPARPDIIYIMSVNDSSYICMYFEFSQINTIMRVNVMRYHLDMGNRIPDHTHFGSRRVKDFQSNCKGTSKLIFTI